MTANGYTGNTPGGGGGGGAVDSVNGRTGAVTLTKTDVGLPLVTNAAQAVPADITAAIAAHVALADPHAQYALDTDLSTGLATKAATSHTHIATQISDSSTVGRAVLVAVDAPTARTAIGAGTSSLALGTTGSTAAAGNDSRLSDARTPTAHAASHAGAGSDPITVTETQVTNLTTDLAAKAPLASPALTGTPTAPTATAATSTTQLATTAFATTADNLKAPLASPTLTGTPTAPTATALDNSTKLATTAYADAADAVNFPMLKWNGAAYVVATGAKVYVGAGTPSTPADGSVWLTS